jgi:hypothetical protein
MASTAPNEQGWNPDLIELQLAHAERNRVRAPASRLAERRKMMQAWADYLDVWRGEDNPAAPSSDYVVPIHASRSAAGCPSTT